MQTEAREPAFVADVERPERRRLYITRTGIAGSNTGAAPWLGWEIVISRIGDDGDEQPLADHWDTTFLEALRYPSRYATGALAWRWLEDGEPADLRALQPAFDESGHLKTALGSLIRPDGAERLCFNLYDDGVYRFVRERRIQEDGLTAWTPEEWSAVPHNDLASAQREARETFDWAAE